MRILKQPANGYCLLYSAAMVLDVDPDELIKEIGVNPLEEWWPEVLPEKRIRGYHVQEIVDCFLARGYAITIIEARPRLAAYAHVDARTIRSASVDHYRLENYLDGNQGILVGVSLNGMDHACAWDGKNIFDPARGVITDIDQFIIREFLMKSNLSEKKFKIPPLTPRETRDILE